MKGIIIYEKEVAQNRSWFIHKFVEEFEKLGICLELKYTEECKNMEKTAADFAIVRTIDPNLSRRLEEAGIVVYNSAEVSKICNNKAQTYEWISKNTDLPFQRVIYPLSEEIMQEEKYPLVLKALNGHGGTEVYWISEFRQLVSLVPDYDNGNYLAQEPVSDLGEDVRVYVVGGQIAGAMKRISDSSFKSNYCLGGRAQKYDLSQEEMMMVRQVTDKLNLGMAGIDFIFHHGSFSFNEIEDVAGCRMLYDLTDTDIVKMYAEYIKRDMEREKKDE